MSEAAARDRVAALAGPRFARIERFVDLLTEESARQNLVSLATLPHVWERHILDSIQLAACARAGDSHWVDIGSGGGLPGIVLACLGQWRVTMIEPRRGRVAFLDSCIDALELDGAAAIRASAHVADVARADIVSARAVASIGDLFAMTRGFSDAGTRFVLPRGVGAAEDVANARAAWHGMFHVEHSETQAGAGIVVADKVKPK